MEYEKGKAWHKARAERTKDDKKENKKTKKEIAGIFRRKFRRINVSACHRFFPAVSPFSLIDLYLTPSTESKPL
jgi:hypothetical protein